MQPVLYAGDFGVVNYVQPKFDAVFIVPEGELLKAVGTARASEKVRNNLTVYFYGWAVDYTLSYPGGRVEGPPTLVWRARARGVLGEISKNNLVALRPGCRPEEGDVIIDGWIDGQPHSGGVFAKEGLYKLDTQLLIHGLRRRR